MGTNKLAVLTLKMDAADGGCGFSMQISSVGTEVDVRNIAPADMVRQLRQMAIDLPLHLERSAASIEARNESGQLNTRVQ